MAERRHACLHCGETWIGRKRKFCYRCLPDHAADPASYRRRYRELLIEWQQARERTVRECSVCGAAFQASSGSLRCKTCVDAGIKLCKGCREPFDAPKFLYCVPCRTKTCPECGTPFLSKDVCCSQGCSAARKVRQKQEQSRRRRVRRRGVLKGPYHDLEIFDRDGWRCGICGGLTLPWKRVPHPKAPTIDHIIPLAAGGADAPTNVQCAHFKCNTKKGARVQNEQPRLVG